MCDFADEVLIRFIAATGFKVDHDRNDPSPEEEQEFSPRIGPNTQSEQMLSEEALRVLRDNLTFTERFKNAYPKIGDTIHVRKPLRYVGPILDPGISMQEAEGRCGS